MNQKKKCTKCEVIKPINEFGLLPHGKDGRRTQCLECDRKYQKAYRRAKASTPKEGEAYLLNSETIRNHFYIHFGFTIEEKENWRLDFAKYHKKPIIDQINSLKRRK